MQTETPQKKTLCSQIRKWLQGLMGGVSARGKLFFQQNSSFHPKLETKEVKVNNMFMVVHTRLEVLLCCSYRHTQKHSGYTDLWLLLLCFCFFPPLWHYCCSLYLFFFRTRPWRCLGCSEHSYTFIQIIWAIQLHSDLYCVFTRRSDVSSYNLPGF